MLNKRLLTFLLVTLILIASAQGCAKQTTSSVGTTEPATIPATIFTGNPLTTAASPTTSPTFQGPPPATILQQQMIEIDAPTLWNDYQKDANAAAAKYEGRLLHFPRVIVENMSYMGEGPDLEYYVQQGMVKFRTEIWYDIWPVRTGFTVEIIGQVTGFNWNYLNVAMSKIIVIDPPGGVGGGSPPPEY